MWQLMSQGKYIVDSDCEQSERKHQPCGALLVRSFFLSERLASVFPSCYVQGTCLAKGQAGRNVQMMSNTHQTLTWHLERRGKQNLAVSIRNSWLPWYFTLSSAALQVRAWRLKSALPRQVDSRGNSYDNTIINDDHIVFNLWPLSRE